MSKRKLLPERGFTLIELMVVISLISFFSTVVIGSLNSVRYSAQDARTLAELRSVIQALDLYALNNGGQYPGEYDDGWYGIGNSEVCPEWAISMTGILAPNYMSQPPASWTCFYYVRLNPGDFEEYYTIFWLAEEANVERFIDNYAPCITQLPNYPMTDPYWNDGDNSNGAYVCFGKDK